MGPATSGCGPAVAAEVAEHRPEPCPLSPDGTPGETTARTCPASAEAPATGAFEGAPPGRPDATAHGSATVALLVLAQRAPRCLEALARTFATPGYQIYVHLDRKVDGAAHALGRRWPGSLTFVAERFEVFWGGFNMIRATESLARDALQEPRHAAFALVSDDTLPLLPPAQIHAALGATADRIDVSLSRRNPPFLRRYTDWFFLDSAATSARPLAVQDRAVNGTALEALGRLTRLQERGKFPLPEVWSGSQWWTLGRETLTAVLEELAGNEWLRESFEFSAVPDELAFQTIHANRLGLAARSFTGPMLTDMSREPAPFAFRALEEVPPVPPGKLFVRKIADEAAANLIAQLEARWKEV